MAITQDKIQAARDAGYTDQEIQAHLQGNQSSGSNKSFTQNASDVLRNLGLGALPDAGAAAVGVAQGGIGPNNPFITQDQFKNVKQQGQMNTAKDAAGLASYMVPETKIAEGGGLLTKLLSGILNRGVQGGIQGGLNAASQGQNPIQGAAVGAVTNPVVSGAGQAVTDILPRYIGLRNFGPAGINLPEVTKAENAAGGSLEQARSDVLKGIKPFELNPSIPGGQTDRQAVLDKINELANSTQWKGTNGLSDLVKRSTKAYASQQGAAPDIKSLVNNSNDLFDAYSQIKNYASSLGAYGSKQDDKLASFLRSAGGVIREHLINTSENPDVTRNAMDMYASQTAMGASSKGNNKLMDVIKNAATKGGGEAGFAALTSIIPALHAFTAPALIDAALTNGVTGPPIARGLVNAGQTASNTGIADILRRLSISGAQGAISQNAQQ